VSDDDSAHFFASSLESDSSKEGNSSWIVDDNEVGVAPDGLEKQETNISI